MEEYGKRVNVYRGIWIAYICMFAFTVGAFALLFYTINRYFNHPLEVTINICLGYTGIIGALLTLICFFYAAAPGLLPAVGDRIRETRLLFGKVFCKNGFQWYWQRFVEDGGFLLWSFVPIFIFYACVAAYGITGFCNWYFAGK